MAKPPFLLYQIKGRIIRNLGGGGGLEEILKNVCRHKRQKKFVENVVRKKFIDGIDEKYVDKNKPLASRRAVQ